MAESSSEMKEEMPGLSRRQRRILWALAGLGVLLILIFTPPLISVNRLQRRIAASMSASLGRTVHLDRASMHVFPVPGFTLENLVVSEDPAFGAEPVIRANTVEVALRPSSLWRRQVEFSSIKFEEPSLNLVRSAQGVWNIQSLLMHAASVQAAPTAQRRAGPAPRFPYIEATGGRVNFKLGEEKKPFSLTEADFALWLPSPQEWRVRLEGQPARTDTNLSDPGTVRVEGSLGRAASMAAVPVDLKGSWEGVPLGEASKMLRGEDANWRGNLSVSAALVGTLGAAKLTSKIHLEELRRADFVPLQTLDLRVACDGTMDVVTAVVRNTECSLHAPAAGGSKVAGSVVAMADGVDLSSLDVSGLRVGVTELSNAWLLDWARLFSQRIPAGERPGGTVAGSLVFAPAPKGGAAVWLGKSWNGEMRGHVDGLLPWKTEAAGLQTTTDKGPAVHFVVVTSSAAGFLLGPVALNAPALNGLGPDAPGPNALGLNAPAKVPALTLSVMATRAGYTVHLTGTATVPQIAALGVRLPPLWDGVQEALPKAGSGSAATRPVRLDVTCTRTWGAAQTCTAATAAAVKKSRRR